MWFSLGSTLSMNLTGSAGAWAAPQSGYCHLYAHASLLLRVWTELRLGKYVISPARCRQFSREGSAINVGSQNSRQLKDRNSQVKRISTWCQESLPEAKRNFLETLSMITGPWNWYNKSCQVWILYNILLDTSQAYFNLLEQNRLVFKNNFSLKWDRIYIFRT